jgi:regulatory protein
VSTERSDRPERKARPGLSLKGRALKYLAAREHSRIELTRKLAPHAESPEQVQQVLDELEAKDLLSAERFAESVVHRKASRMGVRRLKAELQQHALPAGVAEQALAGLAEAAGTELQRAHALWLRRFGALPQDDKEMARQHRFFLARGFSGEVVRQVLKGKLPDEFLD